MAAVNFYRFASAVMELLRPDNEQGHINSLSLLNSEVSTIASNVGDANKNSVASQALSAALSNESLAPAESSNINEVKADVATVEAVAAHLTKALENASQDKINIVAQALETVAVQAQTEQTALSTDTVEVNFQKQVLVETLEMVKESTENNKNENGSRVNTASVNESIAQTSATFVQAAVEMIAKQTVKEVESKLNVETTQVNNLPVVVSPEIKMSSDEVKTTVEKAIQKQEALANSVNLSNVDDLEGISQKEILQSASLPIKDFWETYQEADPANIKYEGLMRHAYSYMSRNALLDSLNPEIQVGNRRDTIFEAFGNASSEIVLENNRYSNFEREASNLLSNLREDHDDLAEELRPDQAESEHHQRLMRQRLEQKLAKLILND